MPGAATLVAGGFVLLILFWHMFVIMRIVPPDIDGLTGGERQQPRLLALRDQQPSEEKGRKQVSQSTESNNRSSPPIEDLSKRRRQIRLQFDCITMLFEDWDENADQYSTEYKLAVARIAKNQSDIAMKLAEDTTEEFRSDVRQNKEKIDQIVQNIEGDLSKDVSKNGQLRFDEKI